MSIEEMHEWYWEQADILAHNRRVLAAKRWRVQEFRKELWGIIDV